MKKHGMLNRDIATLLAHLGHTDTVVIADCGLPVPDEVPCIDVSLSLGVPRFMDVVAAVTDDMEVERLTLAKEMEQDNAGTHEQIRAHLQDQPIRYLTHEEFKAETKKAKAIIRTGETMPYANVILHAGVIF